MSGRDELSRSKVALEELCDQFSSAPHSHFDEDRLAVVLDRLGRDVACLGGISAVANPWAIRRMISLSAHRQTVALDDEWRDLRRLCSIQNDRDLIDGAPSHARRVDAYPRSIACPHADARQETCSLPNGVDLELTQSCSHCHNRWRKSAQGTISASKFVDQVLCRR